MLPELALSSKRITNLDYLMVSDDKDQIYKNLKSKSKQNNTNFTNISNPSSKFLTVHSSEKINLYSAMCTDCHHEIKLNFEPDSNEPFYCDYCANNHRIQHFKNNV